MAVAKFQRSLMVAALPEALRQDSFGWPVFPGVLHFSVALGRMTESPVSGVS